MNKIKKNIKLRLERLAWRRKTNKNTKGTQATRRQTKREQADRLDAIDPIQADLFSNDTIELLKIAVPSVVSLFLVSLLGFVDSLVLGRVGAHELAAAGLATALFNPGVLVGVGLLSAVDYFVPKSIAEGRKVSALVYAKANLRIATILSIVLTLLIQGCMYFYDLIGASASLSRSASDFIYVASASYLPLFLSIAYANFLRALGKATLVVVAYVFANIVNFVFNYWFVLSPVDPFGVAAWLHRYLTFLQASAFSSVLARVACFGVLYFYYRREVRSLENDLEAERLQGESKIMVAAPTTSLLQLGVPAAGNAFLEVAIFAAVTMMAGRLSETSGAAHQVVLQLASLTFMLPFGLSGAASVVVARAVGEHSFLRIRFFAHRTLYMATSIMIASALLFVFIPDRLIGFFDVSEEVHQVAKKILIIAAAFQIFDGLQVTAIGILRGLGNTKITFYGNAIGHWFVGMPVAWFSCFYLENGLRGLWHGLLCGLAAVSTLMCVAVVVELARYRKKFAV